MRLLSKIRIDALKSTLLAALYQILLLWIVMKRVSMCMTLINLPACMVLGNVAVRALKDYEKQKREGKNPSFRAKEIGLNTEELDYWK